MTNRLSSTPGASTIFPIDLAVHEAALGIVAALGETAHQSFGLMFRAERTRHATIRIVGIVKAKFADGVLRPETPLRLRQGEDVRLLVMRQSDPERWNLQRLSQPSEDDLALAEAGLGEWADALDA